MMHVSVMMLSYATLLVGSLVAVAFLIVTQGQGSSPSAVAPTAPGGDRRFTVTKFATEEVHSPVEASGGGVAVASPPATSPNPPAIEPGRHPR